MARTTEPRERDEVYNMHHLGNFVLCGFEQEVPMTDVSTDHVMKAS